MKAALLFLALVGAAPAQTLSYLFEEQVRLVEVTRPGVTRSHFDPATYSQPPGLNWVGSRGAFPIASTGSPALLSWVSLQPNSLAIVVADTQIGSPGVLGLRVQPTLVLAVAVADSSGRATVLLRVPATLPLSVAPAGRTAFGWGQVVEVCPTGPCASSFAFSIETWR